MSEMDTNKLLTSENSTVSLDRNLVKIPITIVFDSELSKLGNALLNVNNELESQKLPSKAIIDSEISHFGSENSELISENSKTFEHEQFAVDENQELLNDDFWDTEYEDFSESDEMDIKDDINIEGSERRKEYMTEDVKKSQLAPRKNKKNKDDNSKNKLKKQKDTLSTDDWKFEENIDSDFDFQDIEFEEAKDIKKEIDFDVYKEPESINSR